MDNKEQYFYHRGSLGDIIYALPTIIAYGGNAIMYLRPCHMECLYRLLKLQPYIIDVESTDKYKGSCINLNGYRRASRIKRSQHLAVTQLETNNKTYDLSQIWLHNIEPNYVADIIVANTFRYHDKEDIDWNILKPFAEKCKFIGYEKERNHFVQKNKIDIPFHKTGDALEIAQVIKGSKLFIGNQSCHFAIAEAMKHTRCLEVCEYYNNCQPHGENGYAYLTTELIEKYINEDKNV